MDANIQKTFACKYLSNGIYTARLSKNGTMITFSSLPRHTSTSCHSWLRKWSGIRCRFWCTIVLLMPETALVSLRTLAFSLSTDNKYLFLQRRLLHFGSRPLHLFQSSHFWRHNFIIGVSDLCSISPWFQLLIIGTEIL